MRFVALIPLGLLVASCGTLTEKPDDIGGSPHMVDVAQDAIIEIAETLQTGGKEVIFKRGRTKGWWNYDTWTYDCRIRFKSDPGDSVSEGRYRIVSTKYRTLDRSDGVFDAINIFELTTLAGEPAEYIRCQTQGEYAAMGTQAVGPITVQTFKRTVGRYLKLVLKEDCDDPVNANICSSN